MVSVVLLLFPYAPVVCCCLLSITSVCNWYGPGVQQASVVVRLVGAVKRPNHQPRETYEMPLFTSIQMTDLNHPERCTAP